MIDAARRAVMKDDCGEQPNELQEEAQIYSASSNVFKGQLSTKSTLSQPVKWLRPLYCTNELVLVPDFYDDNISPRR